MIPMLEIDFTNSLHIAAMYMAVALAEEAGGSRNSNVSTQSLSAAYKSGPALGRMIPIAVEDFQSYQL